MSEKDLLKQIEWLRRKLNDFAISRSLVDQEVVNLSQRLDRLLNQYHGIKKEVC